MGCLLMVPKSGVYRLTGYSTNDRVLYISGGCLGFLPSTVQKLPKTHKTNSGSWTSKENFKDVFG